MGIIYGDGSGSVYQELVGWLTSDLEDLQIAGALAMGNFARSGECHCPFLYTVGSVIRFVCMCIHYTFYISYIYAAKLA